MSQRKRFSAFFILLCALLPWNSTAVNQEHLATRLLPKKIAQYAPNIEGMLVQILSEIKQGQVNQALSTVEQLLKKTPNFKLAHAIKGDLLLAKSAAISQFGNTGLPSKTAVNDLKLEAEKRLESYFDANKSKIKPNLLIQLNNQQQHVLVLDVTKSRLYLYKKNNNDDLAYVADYYVTIGKNGFDKKVEGDKRTPLGVYFAATKLNRQLPDMYGIGAYPLNYPNEIDQYEHRNGSGIWIHGTPSDTYSRTPRASDGCVVLSNPDLKALQPILNKGNTPVIIANNLEWVAAADNTSSQPAVEASLSSAVEAWRQDWANVRTKQYLSHYSKHFFSSKGDYQAWASYKKRVLAGKTKLQVDVSNMSMFAYPTARNPMVVVTFNQYFKSPTLKNRMVKRQYWVKEGQVWKIIYEGAA